MPLAPGKNELVLQVHRVLQDKTNSCWYAAAQMVLAYRDVVMSAVNMSTNPDAVIRYLGNQRLGIAAVNAFADEVGLHKDQSLFHKGFTKDTYGTYLATLGPLWMAGRFPQGGHVVVVCGIVGDNVKVADPDWSMPFPRWIPVADMEAIRSAWNLPVLYRLNGPGR